MTYKRKKRLKDKNSIEKKKKEKKLNTQ